MVVQLILKVNNMKVTIKTETILVLDDFEKEWLKAVMQNPLSSHETIQDRQMREKFWNSLNPTPPLPSR